MVVFVLFSRLSKSKLFYVVFAFSKLIKSECGKPPSCLMLVVACLPANVWECLYIAIASDKFAGGPVLWEFL